MKHALSGILYILACLAMAGSIFVLLLVASLLSVDVAVALQVAPLTLALSKAIPAQFVMWGALPSPLGGVFRTDFFIVALVLFVAARLLRKIARAL